MRIILITQDINPIFKMILSLKEHEVVGVIEDLPRRKPENFLLLRKLISLFKHNTLKKQCSINKVPYISHSNEKKGEVAKWVETLQPDLIVVYSMSRLLSKNIYQVPKYGTINLHPSLLPNYKGRNPWIALYANQDLEPGVTVHYIDGGEDSGEIILQQTYKIESGTKVEDAIDIAIAEIGCRLLKTAINLIDSGEVNAIAQTDALLYCSEKFDSNKDVIDWMNWNVDHVWHFLKGTQLWGIPLSLPSYGKYKFSTWYIGDVYSKFSSPDFNNLGTLVRHNDFFLLKCKDGQISIKYRFTLKSILKAIIN